MTLKNKKITLPDLWVGIVCFILCFPLLSGLALNAIGELVGYDKLQDVVLSKIGLSLCALRVLTYLSLILVFFALLIMNKNLSKKREARRTSSVVNGATLNDIIEQEKNNEI